MILEQETHEAFGYYPSDLSHGSHKKIIAVCDGCGIVRVTSKNRYHSLCKSCVRKGKTHTEEHKRKISETQKGKTVTDEAKAKMSEALKGKIGEEAPAWKGGKKLSWARMSAKRRQLGFNPLNASFECSEGHHVSKNNVIYIPKALHRSIWHNIHTGRNMLKTNALALDFLVRGI